MSRYETSLLSSKCIIHIPLCKTCKYGIQVIGNNPSNSNNSIECHRWGDMYCFLPFKTFLQISAENFLNMENSIRFPKFRIPLAGCYQLESKQYFTLVPVAFLMKIWSTTNFPEIERLQDVFFWFRERRTSWTGQQTTGPVSTYKSSGESCIFLKTWLNMRFWINLTVS